MPKQISEKEAQGYLEKYEDQTAVYIAQTVGGYRFRVARGNHATEVIVPKRPNDSHYRQIDRTLELYFSVFGVGNPAPYVGVRAKA